MYTVLLSGGSGKRLWPLSNDLRSKQYIKLISKEDSKEQCSMIQRVWSQLEKNGLSESCIITASTGQVEIIKSQLGNINIAIEPDRRDTFPAIVLSCAYLVDKLGAGLSDCVAFLPVDPYTESKYYETVKRLQGVLDESGAEIALMGVIPKEPSSKFGYILPDPKEDTPYYRVNRFIEKPNENDAKKLIKSGALWNCGVFCVRIGYILSRVAGYDLDAKYDHIFHSYDKLPKISFDYEVLEQAKDIVVLPYDGLWEDLGTWDAITNEMDVVNVGKCISDRNTQNTNVINELDIPVVTMGIKNAVIVASFDGILVADKEESNNIKDVIRDVELKSMYEERRWGTLKTLDLSETESGFTLLRKIKMFKDKSSSYHYHNEREESITVLSGRGEMIIEGVRLLLFQGMTLTIPYGKRHAIRAISNLEYIEIHIGKQIGDEDINRITFNWDEIEKE